jgi:hypothetical protein
MAVRYSTKLRNVQAAAVKTALADGVIDLYTGTQPATPDSPAVGTKIGRITLGGNAFVAGTATNGLEFDAPVLDVLSKASAEEWKFTALADGRIAWARFIGNATDDNSTSTALPRMDFTVGITTGDARTGKVDYLIGEPGVIQALALTYSNPA